MVRGETLRKTKVTGIGEQSERYYTQKRIEGGERKTKIQLGGVPWWPSG